MARGVTKVLCGSGHKVQCDFLHHAPDIRTLFRPRPVYVGNRHQVRHAQWRFTELPHTPLRQSRLESTGDL
jgi:hypothetical protein